MHIVAVTCDVNQEISLTLRALKELSNGLIFKCLTFENLEGCGTEDKRRSQPVFD